MKKIILSSFSSMWSSPCMLGFLLCPRKTIYNNAWKQVAIANILAALSMIVLKARSHLKLRKHQTNRFLAQCPNTKIIINRSANESIAPLQNANFANKLDIDLYISIHAFAETEIKPRIFLYQFSYHDDIIAKRK